MGKLRQGILGGISGSVGNVTGSSWKGIPVIKSKPLSVANPKTAAQQSQRSKFANIVNFAQKALADVIKPLNDRFAIQQSGFNAFISRNIGLFGSYFPEPYNELEISGGNMAATSITGPPLDPSNDEIQIDWSDDSGEGLKLSDDQLYAIAWNGTTGEQNAYPAVASRSATTVTLSFSSMSTSDEIYVCVAFRRNDGTVASKTSSLMMTA